MTAQLARQAVPVARTLGCRPGCHDWREYQAPDGKTYRRCLRATCHRWDLWLGHVWQALQ